MPVVHQSSRMVPEPKFSSIKLLYFTTAYPNVSHTFIKRELRELERLGFSVLRVAIRCGEAIVEREDVEESERTLHLTSMGLLRTVTLLLSGLVTARRGVFKGLRMTWTLAHVSNLGVLKHLAYFCEAAILFEISRRARIDHIHVHFGTNATSIALLCRELGGPPYSVTVHGPDEFDAPRSLSLGLKVHKAAFVVAISSFCLSQLQRWSAHEDWNKIHVVHCAVNEGWFDAASELQEGTHDIVCIGRLSEQKGHLLLIEAFAQVVAENGRGDLILIGDGDLRTILEGKVSALGITNRVQLRGWCNATEIRRILLASRALVVPSFAEGLPVVIMEAMALSRVVVASNIAGIGELVVDGQTGFLVTAGDVDDLTAKLLQLQESNLVSLRVIGDAARKKVRECHSTKSEVSKLATLFLQNHVTPVH